MKRLRKLGLKAVLRYKIGLKDAACIVKGNIMCDFRIVN